MGDISIGEQQIRWGEAVGFDLCHTALNGPKLAGPAGRSFLSMVQLQASLGPCFRDQRFNDIASAITAAVIDDHDVKLTGIVLTQKRPHRTLDHKRFITSRDDRNDRRPCRQVFFASSQHRSGPPESMMCYKEIEPNRER